MKFEQEIKQYIPYNEQEEKDKQVIISCMNNFKDVYTRENVVCHFAPTAFCVNKQRTKMLMIYHNQMDSWVWPGGHADGNSDLLEVAMQELKEETGLTKATPITKDIFSLEVFCMNSHRKKGKYIACHLHLDTTFLIEADESEKIRIKADENKDVKWVPLEEVTKLTSQPHMIPIYEKAFKKLKEQY